MARLPIRRGAKELLVTTLIEERQILAPIESIEPRLQPADPLPEVHFHQMEENPLWPNIPRMPRAVTVAICRAARAVADSAKM